MPRMMASEDGRVVLLDVSLFPDRVEAGAGYFGAKLPEYVVVTSEQKKAKLHLAEAFTKIATSAFEVNLVISRCPLSVPVNTK